MQESFSREGYLRGIPMDKIIKVVAIVLGVVLLARIIKLFNIGQDNEAYGMMFLLSLPVILFNAPTWIKSKTLEIKTQGREKTIERLEKTIGAANEKLGEIK